MIAVVGDAALANGTSFEALNNCVDTTGKVIIVLNDNEAPLSSGEYRAAVFIDENAEATFKNCDFNLRNGAA